MSIQQLKKELASNKLRSLYIFSGEEKGVMWTYVDRIKKASGYESIRVENLEEVRKKAVVTGLFTKNYLLLLEGKGDKIGDIELEDIERIIKNHILIIIVDSIDKRKRLYKKVPNLITEFQKMDEDTVIKYIKMQVEIDDANAKLLSTLCNRDILRIDNELDKLKRLGRGFTRPIILEVVHADAEFSIFELIDTIAQKKVGRAMKLYNYLTIEPIKFVYLMYMKFKQILLVQSYLNLSNAEIAAKTGLTFYQVNMTKDSCNKFTNDELLDILKLIQSVEIDIKSGRLNQQLGADYLIANILSRA
jgi:DNA polymerase III delta subunit